MKRWKPENPFELESLEPRLLLSGESLLDGLASLADEDPGLTSWEEFLLSTEIQTQESAPQESESYDPAQGLDDLYSVSATQKTRMTQTIGR